MKRKYKEISLVLIDIFLMNLSLLFTLYMHYEGNIPIKVLNGFMSIAIPLLLMKIAVFYKLSLYKSLWSYASVEELIKVVAAVMIGNSISIIYILFSGIRIFYGVYILAALIEILLIGGFRFSYRFFRSIKNKKLILGLKECKNVLIIGSGATASFVAQEIKNHPQAYGRVIGYIDDDKEKEGVTIAGIKVLGNRYDIYSIVKRHHVDEIVVASPTSGKKELREILNEAMRSDAKVRIVPGVTEIIDGKVSLSKIRDVGIGDLLGREAVDLNVYEIASYLEEKVVMVTGGGGSIGSELCRQIAKFSPRKLIILDIYENNAYDIQRELSSLHGKKFKLEVLIASVRERNVIFEIMKREKPNVVFHAAAHKHVPLMEDAPKEAIKNNVFGTMNVAEAADEAGVERFVLISTDKAVNPTNIMGASKRMCEMIIQGLEKTSKTKFVAVRFGNVLGSNGSVIPLFKKQISEGGPVTITHKDIIRYFMTIPEAAQLVIQASAIANGGEIFVLDMGEPVRIYDLAVDLIKLSGLEPEKDIQIEVTGLRPGEKLYEELLMDDEGLINTQHKKIFVGGSEDVYYPLLRKSFEQLRADMDDLDNDEIKEYVKRLVPTYLSSKDAPIDLSYHKHLKVVKTES